MPPSPSRRGPSRLRLAGWILGAALLAPVPAQAQEVDPAALEGAWVRTGSTYDPNDEMRIRIAGNRAIIVRVPASVHRAFKVGANLWTGIAADGSVRVFGSDGNFYPGRLRLDPSGQLRVTVDHSGPGSTQTWRRAGPSVDGDWVRIAPGDGAADGMRVLADATSAAIRFLPADAPRRFRIGSTLWRGIGAGGVVEVFQASGGYRAARVTLEGDDRLYISADWLAQPELWVRPAIVDEARAAAASPTAGSTACVNSSLFDHGTGLVWGWGLEYGDGETTRAERLGLLDYRAGTLAPAAVLAEIERYELPGMAPGFMTIWQRPTARGRLASVDLRDLSAAGYDSRSESYRREGYRAQDIEVYEADGPRFAGVWVSNPDDVDWVVDHSLTSAEFGQRFGERRGAGFRMVDVEAYPTGAGLRYAAVWHKSCGDVAWREFRGMTPEVWQRRVDSLDALGFQVIDVESYPTPDGQRYAAIWEQVPGVAWAVRTNRTLNWFLNYHRQYTDQGFRLVDVESYETAEGRRYAGVWAENDPRYRLAMRRVLDDSLEAYRTTHRLPGISVAILHRGELVYGRGFGWADSAAARQAHAGTVYITASIAKAIGGTLAARLEARGVLDLSRPTAEFLDDLPAGHTHTVEQLFAKTGCVIHYAEGPEPPKVFYRTQAEAYRTVVDSLMLPNCTPGQRWHYSTHGFTLAGAVLEEVTGKTLGQLIDEELARPAALRSLRLSEGPPIAGGPPLSYHLATPYRYDSASARSVPTVAEEASWKLLGGGLQSNALDLARFGWFTLNGWFVGDSVRDNRLWAPLTTGMRRWSNSTLAAVPTALGWEVRELDSRPVAEHGGDGVGATTHLRIYRDDGLVIAIMSNQQASGSTFAGHPVESLASQLARIVFANLP